MHGAACIAACLKSTQDPFRFPVSFASPLVTAGIEGTGASNQANYARNFTSSELTCSA